MRVFAALCAAGLVAAFALAALLPPDMDLAAVLLALDPHSLPVLHSFTLHHAASVWNGMLLPFLRRPAWMLPLMAGVVAGGVAVSLNYFNPKRQSTHRSG